MLAPLPVMTDGDRNRVAYARANGFQVIYSQVAGGRYESWTDTEEGRYFLPSFHTLQGLQDYAKRHRFAIVYVQ